MSRRTSALAVVLLLALALLAGCGSGSGKSKSATAAGGGTTTPTSSGAATVATSSTGLGTILVAGGGRTVYLFQRDSGPHSTCSSACATNWPPLTTAGAPKAGGGATAAMLGTTKRADGTTQVTYAGHPLYFFAGDSSAGQTNGQGVSAFGATWYAVAPSGAAVTKQASGSSGGGGARYGY